MQGDVAAGIQAWLFALLVYPGLLFGVLLALVAEWLAQVVRPRLAPPLFRAPLRPYHLLQPLFTFMKLAGRSGPARWSTPNAEPAGGGPGYEGIAYLSLAGAAAPVLVLALLPLPGNPAVAHGAGGDVLLVPALLAVQPLLRALSRLFAGGTSALEGARQIGRLLAGAVPTLVALAALVEMADSGSISLRSLTGAPESAWQFFARWLVGLILLIALPWWADTHDSGDETAGSLAGRHLQWSALAAVWTVLVLPLAGDVVWALVIALLGALAAAVAVRLVPFLWVPTRAERDRAALLWTAVLPAALVVLLVSLWVGA